jgi:hypothetical protein
VTQLAEIEPRPNTVIGQGAPDATGSAVTDEARSVGWADHPINIRLSIPLLFGRRYHLTVVAGRERRRPDRLIGERRKHPLATRRNLTIILAVGVIIGLALYGLQLMLGLWALERLVVA